MSNTTEAIVAVPTGAALGAEIRGVDFREPVPDGAARELRALWAAHLVLLFRGQALDDERLLEVADVFGGRQVAGSRAYFIKAGHKPGESARVAEKAAISVISNLDDGGKLAPGAGGNAPLKWHSDNSYVETPPRGSLLHAHRVPRDGGGVTSFNNQYLAYEGLPERLKTLVEGKHICHDNTRNTTGAFRPTIKPPESRADIHGPVHPIVRVHPETGRRALYLGRHYAWPSSYVVELDDDASEALLAELWEHATSDALVWSHHWQDGDLLLWDNRCTMHARSAVDHTQQRVMHRALVKGEAVVSAWPGVPLPASAATT